MRHHFESIPIVRRELFVVWDEKPKVSDDAWRDVTMLVDTEAAHQGTVDGEIALANVLCRDKATIDR